MNTDEKVQWILQKTREDGGLAPVDLERFWADNRAACANPWGFDIPQMPMALNMNFECVLGEFDLPECDARFQKDAAYRAGLFRAYNEKAMRIVGRKFMPEPPTGDTGTAPQGPPRALPAHKALNDIFEARNEWHSGSYWLMQVAHDEDGLAALLDRVEARLANLRPFLLPENWDEEKARLAPLGVKPGIYRMQRGPVTFAASVYGTENLMLLVMTNPILAGRYRDAIMNAMLGLARVMDEEAGYSPETAPRGFMFLDDNCYLLNPEMYEFFGYPILKGIFDRYCPDPGDRRAQHSDSPMAHLLPIFGQLDLKWVNFGPTVTVTQIREHIPGALIAGQLAPYAFSRNQEETIVRQTLRDFELSREKRGLVFDTAGGINHGSRLTGLRLVMSTIQNFCRHDG